MGEDDRTKRHEGGLHEGPSHTAPYPLSRLAPVHDLVDVAAEIQRADATLGTVTEGKLKVIVDQIRALQDEARHILERARHDGDLHRATCNLQKRPGHVYHLYRRPSGETFFSLFGPTEWTLAQDHVFVGSYRLELDMSFTPLGEAGARDAEDAVVRRLLAR